MLFRSLSYFLWSSLPDAELMSHADRGDLHTDAVIDAQVRRMLADPESITRMRHASTRLARPDAALDIARLVEKVGEIGD